MKKGNLHRVEGSLTSAAHWQENPVGFLLIQAAGNPKQPLGQWGKFVDRKGDDFSLP